MRPQVSRSGWLCVGLTIGLLVSASSARAQVGPCTVEPISLTTFTAASGRYQRAGAVVPLDRQRMVQVGRRGDVPIYTDTTVEPWSQLLIPVARGWLQPYERRREGELAGTSGSRLPSFPVALARDDRAGADATDRIVLMAPAPPERSSAGLSGSVDCARVAHEQDSGSPAADHGLVEDASTPPQSALVVIPLTAPAGNRGIWVPFEGDIWRAEGAARAQSGLALTPAGRLGTRTVFRLPDQPDAIYLPLRDGTVTRFTRDR